MGEVDEIVVHGDGFFRIHLEKDPGANTELRCPSELPVDVLERIRQVGRTVYEALNCSGFARVDLFVTPRGRGRVQRGQLYARHDVLQSLPADDARCRT